MDDFYVTLGVPPNAGAAEIKSRYRFLSHAYHPDKFSSDAHKREAEEAFKKINEAFQTLSDPRLRSIYDRQRASGSSNQPNSSPPPPRPPPPPPPQPPPQPPKPPEWFHPPPTTSQTGFKAVPLSPREIAHLAIVVVVVAGAFVASIYRLLAPSPYDALLEPEPAANPFDQFDDAPQAASKPAFDPPKPWEAESVFNPATVKPFDPDSYLASKAPRKPPAYAETTETTPPDGFVLDNPDARQKSVAASPLPNPYADLGAIPAESQKPPQMTAVPKFGFEKTLEADFKATRLEPVMHFSGIG